jgi:hypothetical protein
MRRPAWTSLAALTVAWFALDCRLAFATDVPNWDTSIAVAGGVNSVAAPSLAPPVVMPATIVRGGQQIDVQRLGASATLTNTGDYHWWYGCSPTAAGMLIGYYDRNGYAGKSYNDMVRGGVAETSSYGNPGALVNTAIASPRHVADFYGGGYAATGDDVTGAPTGPPNCLADFMHTSQDAAGNANGFTTFYNFSDGSKLYAKDAYNYGVSNLDGMFGIFQYIESYAGYDLGAPDSSTQLYSQYILGYQGKTQGFSFDEYKAEIDAGRPVIIQLTGHSMLGYGYDDDGQTIHVFDTWSGGGHTMTWGGSYGGMAEFGVVVVNLAQEPSTLALLAAASVIAAVGYARWRRKEGAGS